MHYTKKEPAKITVHGINGEYLATIFDSFDSLLDIKHYIRYSFGGCKTVAVSVYQDGGYSISFNVNTKN